jgi:hypothetical protein
MSNFQRTSIINLFCFRDLGPLVFLDLRRWHTDRIQSSWAESSLIHCEAVKARPFVLNIG